MGNMFFFLRPFYKWPNGEVECEQMLLPCIVVNTNILTHTQSPQSDHLLYSIVLLYEQEQAEYLRSQNKLNFSLQRNLWTGKDGKHNDQNIEVHTQSLYKGILWKKWVVTTRVLKASLAVIQWKA